MSNQGWIKLHRKILDNPISRKPNYLAIWCYILTRANHSSNYVILDGNKTLIKEGEFVGSLLEISKYFNISISNVSRVLKYLETETMLETTRTSKYTYFSVVNWIEYQEAETKTENKEKTKRKQRETNNNVNKVKNDKKENIEETEEYIFVFNSVLSKQARLTDDRKKAIANFAKKVSIGEFTQAMEKVKISNYLNSIWTNWGFDWFMNEKNFTKVLEGNYDNKGDSNAKANSGYKQNYATGRKSEWEEIEEARERFINANHD